MRFHKIHKISMEEYDALLAAQGGVCAICRRPETKIRLGVSMPLAVDHDHETGKIRGLLCNGCNRGLGMFHDDVDNLIEASFYLQRSR